MFLFFLYIRCLLLLVGGAAGGALLERLLPEILPPKQETRPLEWSYREIIDGILYRLKNGCNWADLPKDLPPYSTVYWHYKQWRKDGTLERLMTVLHERVRGQVGKTAPMDDLAHD